MNSLKILSDNDLIEAYHKAINIKLDKSFIHILQKEINRRGLAS